MNDKRSDVTGTEVVGDRHVANVHTLQSVDEGDVVFMSSDGLGVEFDLNIGSCRSQNAGEGILDVGFVGQSLTALEGYCFGNTTDLDIVGSFGEVGFGEDDLFLFTDRRGNSGAGGHTCGDWLGDSRSDQGNLFHFTLSGNRSNGFLNIG